MRSSARLGRWTLLWALLVTLVGPVSASATSFQQVQNRISEQTRDGAPVVVHVVVALCDNVHQRIVPVPPSLGDGQNPTTNLYWGAAYGVRTFLTRRAGYRLHRPVEPDPVGVLDRIVLQRAIRSSPPRARRRSPPRHDMAPRQTVATIAAGTPFPDTGLLDRPWRPSVARTSSEGALSGSALWVRHDQGCQPPRAGVDCPVAAHFVTSSWNAGQTGEV